MFTLLWVLDNPEIDVLITEYFVFPSYFPKLIELVHSIALLYPLSSTINLDLDHKVVIGIISYSNISLIVVITIIVVGSLFRIFVNVIIRVEENVILVFRTVISIVVIVKLKTIVCSTFFFIINILFLLILCIFVQLICFFKKVFTNFILREVNKFGGSIASIELE